MDDFYFLQTVSPGVINFVLVGLFAVFATVIVAVLVAQYLLFGISIYKTAVLQGVSKPWMAWIPFVRSYLFGKIGDSLNRKSGRLSKQKILLPTLSFVKAIFSVVFIIFATKLTCDIINFVFSIMGDASVVSLLQIIDEDIIVNVISTCFSDFISLLISFIFLLIFYIWFLVVNIKNYNILYKGYAIGSAVVFTAMSTVSYIFSLIFIPPLLLFILLRKRSSISNI